MLKRIQLVLYQEIGILCIEKIWLKTLFWTLPRKLYISLWQTKYTLTRRKVKVYWGCQEDV